MDHRRTQSAQARVYTAPAHPPPGARLPAHLGAVNANPNNLQRRPSTSSADYYATNASIDGSQLYSAQGRVSPTQGFNYSPPIAFPEPQLYRSTSAGAYTPRRQERQGTITPGDYNRALSDESFDRDQYATSVYSFSPEHSPSLRTEAFQQLRYARGLF